MSEPEFELKILESLESQPIREDREAAVETNLETTAEEALEALRATKGAAQIIEQVPGIIDIGSWFPVAIFRVCGKFGSARYLDIWDADHFDGVTDMQRCVNDCRAWFSGDGFESWGSGETKTGRVNCYFTASRAGIYTCNARLQSYPGVATPAVVECLMDNSSFGPLTVAGTINQPHVSNLGAGGHHFRIRQVSGSFFFLSLTIWRTG